MPIVKLRKYVSYSYTMRKNTNKKRKYISCNTRWEEIPDEDDPDVIEFIHAHGDGNYQFIQSGLCVKSLHIKAFGYRSFIDEMERVRLPAWAKLKKSIHCHHCYLLGKSEERKKWKEILDSKVEEAYQEGYHQALDDVDNETENLEEEEEYIPQDQYYPPEPIDVEYEEVFEEDDEEDDGEEEFEPDDDEDYDEEDDDEFDDPDDFEPV